MKPQKNEENLTFKVCFPDAAGYPYSLTHHEGGGGDVWWVTRKEGVLSRAKLISKFTGNTLIIVENIWWSRVSHHIYINVVVGRM